MALKSRARLARGHIADRPRPQQEGPAVGVIPRFTVFSCLKKQGVPLPRVACRLVGRTRCFHLNDMCDLSPWMIKCQLVEWRVRRKVTLHELKGPKVPERSN